MKVNFIDLKRQYLSIKEEIDGSIKNIIDNCNFIRGSEVNQFEESFAQMHSVKNCISCANGTDAIYIALKSLNIKAGDEVIVPAHSWISSSEVVTDAGGKVVFVDTELDSYLIDTSKIEEKITKNTVGIICVHLYGNVCDLGELLRIKNKYSLWLIEDCAQAHFSMYEGQYVGTFGDIGTFSFYPGKNLGAFGDAGAIITEDQTLADHCAKFARHGGLIKGVHEIEGSNSRLDGLQAAVLNVKLKYILDWNEKRRNAAKNYLQLLQDIENLKLPEHADNIEHTWHCFVIRTKERDGLKKSLEQNNIYTNINYPIALPFLQAYAYLKHSKNDFPNAFYNQSKILSLPMFPEILEEEQEYVAENIKKFLNE